MYLVQSKTFHELAQCWYDREPPPDPPPPPDSLTGTGDVQTVRYGEPPAMPEPVVDTLVQHYLNDHVPSTWALVAFAFDAETVRFVWRAPD